MIVYHGHILWAAAHTLRLPDRFRSEVGVPEAEYGVEIEVRRLPPLGMEPLYYEDLHNAYGEGRYETKDTPVLLHRIPIGGRDEFGDVMNIVHVDLYDALGIGRTQSSQLIVKWDVT